MKSSSQLRQQLEKYQGCPIIVEGKKDVQALKSLDFEKVFAIHKNKTSLREAVEKICTEIKNTEVVCILTDFDKKGRYFHAQLKKILQEHGVKVDPSLRRLIAKEGLSHIEGIGKFVERNN